MRGRGSEASWGRGPPSQASAQQLGRGLASLLFQGPLRASNLLPAIADAQPRREEAGKRVGVGKRLSPGGAPRDARCHLPQRPPEGKSDGFFSAPPSFICPPTVRRSQLGWGLTAPPGPTADSPPEARGEPVHTGGRAAALPALGEVSPPPRSTPRSLAGGRGAASRGSPVSSEARAGRTHERAPASQRAFMELKWRVGVGRGGVTCWLVPAAAASCRRGTRCSRRPCSGPCTWRCTSVPSCPGSPPASRCTSGSTCPSSSAAAPAR